jgi:hypothetical protein
MKRHEIKSIQTKFPCEPRDVCWETWGNPEIRAGLNTEPFGRTSALHDYWRAGNRENLALALSEIPG